MAKVWSAWVKGGCKISVHVDPGAIKPGRAYSNLSTYHLIPACGHHICIYHYIWIHHQIWIWKKIKKNAHFRDILSEGVHTLKYYHWMFCITPYYYIHAGFSDKISRKNFSLFLCLIKIGSTIKLSCNSRILDTLDFTQNSLKVSIYSYKHVIKDAPPSLCSEPRCISVTLTV